MYKSNFDRLYEIISHRYHTLFIFLKLFCYIGVYIDSVVIIIKTE